MKRVLSIATLFALTTSQVFSYTTDQLRKLNELAGAVEAASAVNSAISKSGPSDAMQAIAGVSKEVNTLMSYVLMDSGFMPRIARVIERVNSEASWQKTPQIDGKFFKEFCLALSHGIAHEVKSYFQGKGITLALQNVTDNRIVARASNALAEAISSAILETFFARLGHMAVGAEGEDAPQCSKVFISNFGQSLASEIAYHFAGEIIFLNASDTKPTELFNDIFSQGKIQATK